MRQLLIVSCAAGLVACLVFSGGLASATAQGMKPKKQPDLLLVTRETSLGRAHPGEVENTRTLSSDGRRVAFVAKVTAGESVFVDGKPGKTYTKIARDPFSESGDSFPILFSPDGRRVAYVATRGKKYLVVLDGKESGEYDYVHTATLTFSQDGRRFAHSAKRADKNFVVIDGVAVTQYDLAARPRFSEDGRRVSYEATRDGRELFVVDGVEFDNKDPEGRRLFTGEEKKVVRRAEKVEEGDKSFVVVDGLRSGPYDRVGSIRLSQDQKRVMYEARRGDNWFVVVDGVEGKIYDSIHSYSAEFSPDGKHFAYKASEDREHFIVFDGNEGRRYHFVGDFTFGPDGQLMYLAFNDGKTILVTDGIEGASFAGRPGRFQFSLDRKHMIYRVEKLGSGKEVLVFDGVPFEYDEIRNVVFSPDSRHLVVKAQRGGSWVMVVDGVESREYEPDDNEPGKIAYSADDEIAFSADGRRVAYVARRGGKDFVVVDGAEGNRYDDIRNLTFSADGRHVVHTARRGNKHLVVVGGVEGREYDGFLSRNKHEQAEFTFGGTRSLYILARRGQEYLRVEVDIVGE